MPIQETIGTVYSVLGSGFQAIAPVAGYIGIATFALMCLWLPFAGGGATQAAAPAKTE